MANVFDAYFLHNKMTPSPTVKDALNRVTDLTGFSDMLGGGPLPNSSPAQVGQYYTAKVGLGLADLIKSPIALGSKIPDAAEWFYSTPSQKEAPAKATQAEVAKTNVEAAKKANEVKEAQVQQALLNQAKSGGGGGGKGSDMVPVGAPTLDLGEENKKTSSGTSDEDFSKAMLRAGIAMMQSKGDIWDAIGAGFAGYQDTLDDKAKKEAEAAKEAREFGLEKYKADIYNAQTMGNLALASRKGAGGSGDGVGDLIKLKNYELDVKQYQLTARKEMNAMAEQSAAARAGGDVATANNIDYAIYNLGVEAGLINPSQQGSTGASVASGYKKQP